MSTLEVDQFAVPEAREDLRNRCRAIVETVGVLGLQGVNESETPAQLLGGAAWMLQKIDGYLPQYGMPDVDAIVCNPMFTRLSLDPGFAAIPTRLPSGGVQGSVLASATVPLRTDVLTASTRPTTFDAFIGGWPYAGEPSKVASPTSPGILVTHGDIIAFRKVCNPNARVKDLASVIKAQVMADYTNHFIIDSELWRDAVGYAMKRTATNDVQISAGRRLLRRGPAYPSWLRQLVRVDFNHPAFATISRK